jgi:NHLM bacteriocin system ABC transporter ATP-binding protein
MGWFDEQIKERINNDDEMMSDAFAKISSAITGRRISGIYDADRVNAQEAIGQILAFYHIRKREVPDTVRELNDVLEYLLRPSGVMYRTAKLMPGWYRDAAGAMLGTTKDGKIAALMPGKFSGYFYLDPQTGKKIGIGKKNEDIFEDDVICFYRPMPNRKMKLPDFIRYLFGILRGGDAALLVISSLVIMIVGLVTPVITQFIYSRVVQSGNNLLLLAVVTVFLMTGLSTALLTIFRTFVVENLKQKASISTQAAAIMRILSIPADFFKDYSAGDLANRVTAIDTLTGSLFDIVLTSMMTALFSLAYIGQIFAYTPALALPAFSITMISFILTLVTSLLFMKSTNEYMPLASKEMGLVHSLFGGVAKIKNAGAEKRAFAKWADLYAKGARYKYSDFLLVRIRTTLTLSITLFGTVILYMNALSSGVSAANYMAFVAAYAALNGAFNALSSGTSQAAMIGATLKMARPILEAVPEMSEDKPVLEFISGSIEMNNVSFRYTEDMPNVVDNLSLKIRPGEYVAIVGRTGCGKSTLMRLLLGFEKPQKGAVYYDGKDMNSFDVKSLRKKIGVVTQNGKLFMGDIFSNISISDPTMSMDSAWEAARMSGMDEDIKNMPMGMQTMIMEGAGGISGGQRQRLMIARAIAPKPRILMFDEATSALDNITQKIVSDSLNTLKCTRIVIAHRLSTIRNCDRIIVLEGGHIAEEGTYEELIARKGFFSELVARQRVDA